MIARRTGVLALEDGHVYRGVGFGAIGSVVGEAVFNTSMSGYQEILTDPSYHGQILAMTAPQIGNYGVNPDDDESPCPQVRAFLVRDLSPIASNYRSRETLPDYLERHGIPALNGVDTRAITKVLRVHGACKACLSTEDLSDQEAVRRACEWPGLVGSDYVKEVTAKEIFRWDEERFPSTPFTVEGTQLEPPRAKPDRHYIVAIDLGAKYNIFRRLSYHGFDVDVLPADTPVEAVRERNPKGVFLSNGPGDPGAVGYVHKTVAALIEHYPVFGICMGNQMITHALGASTYKLKFGHRGANQPVKNLETGVVAITSQNHGFAASRDELENRGAIVTEINLNDNTVEGLRHKDYPVFSVQYHPEASPGPHDSDPLFAKFHEMVSRNA